VIDPHWSLVDLDPRTWRAIGGFFDPGQYIRAAQPGERGLFVLHDGGRVLRVIDSERGLRPDLALNEVESAADLAAGLYARGEWQRVHIIDKRHLAAVARTAQATPRRDLTLDEYYHLVYRLLWAADGGYVCVPPPPGHWHGWTYAGVRAWLRRLPDPATLALVVLDGAAPAIGLIADWRDGLFRRVTTLETFGLGGVALDLSAASFARLWALLEGRGRTGDGAPPAAVLLCSSAAFAALLAAADKEAALARLGAQGAAFWRLPGAAGSPG
jgi:hypothetical protein